MAPITCCSKNIDRSASRWTGLSVLFGRKGAPWHFAEGGSSLGLKRPLPLDESGGRIWRHGSQPRRPWGSLFRSLTCDIDPRATSLSPSEALSLGHMRLQVLAILENGASKILPKGSDTLRILLILPNPEGAPRSESETAPHRPPASPIRRRVMASLAGSG